MKQKKGTITKHTLIENDRVWEKDIKDLNYSVQKNDKNSSWTVKSKNIVVDQGIQKTIAECLFEMGEKYGYKFELETEREADIRIFGKPIACKRY